MLRAALLVLLVTLSACAYTGHALRNAGAGGSAPGFEPPARADPAEDKPDPRFEEPVRPGTGRASLR